MGLALADDMTVREIRGLCLEAQDGGGGQELFFDVVHYRVVLLVLAFFRVHVYTCILVHDCRGNDDTGRYGCCSTAV